MPALLKELGKYRIIEKLGRGGMADVYLANDTEADRNVALKVVESCAHSTESEQTRAAEERGARLQSKLAELNASVPKIHSYGEIDGHFFVDMEYVEGQDLSELIRRGPLPPKQAAHIALAVCDSLAKAHAARVSVDGKQVHGIVHGDIKPTNLRIDADGKVWVLDLGISKGLAFTRKLTRNEFASIPYSSPERLDSGFFEVGSDLWSLGVVLYEMISGKQPFEAQGTGHSQRLIRQRKIPTLPAACPQALQSIVAKALGTTPTHRYQSAEEFAVDLRAFLDGQRPVADAEALLREQATCCIYPRATPKSAGRPPAHTAGRKFAAAFAAGRTGRWGKGVAMGVVILLVLLVAQEVSVWGDATRLAEQLERRQTDLGGAWSRYQSLSQRSLLGLSTSKLRLQLVQGYLGKADPVIADYFYGKSSSIKPADWRAANRFLKIAHSLDPDNKDVEAKLYYSDGHLLRLVGKNAQAEKAFDRAAQLAPNWPRQTMRSNRQPVAAPVLVTVSEGELTRLPAPRLHQPARRRAVVDKDDDDDDDDDDDAKEKRRKLKEKAEKERKKRGD